MRPTVIDNPPNPWLRQRVVYEPDRTLPEHRAAPGVVEEDLAEHYGISPPTYTFRVFEDHTKEILSKNDSPDLGFRYSVNPYRGCFHGCAYCYARPTHEYLGFGAGTDFERVIVVKPNAPELLRRALGRRSWRREPILFSGATDCYQPLEASYRLTRGCLEACLEANNPVFVITKSALIERDRDLLVALARSAGADVTLSIPFADDEMARKVEPYAPAPSRRFVAVERLSQAGLRVSVNIAPVIPGLSESQIPAIVKRAAEAGALGVASIVLRLPGSVAPVFEARMRERFPLTAAKILARTREVRSGRLNDPRFGSRMTGEGEYAAVIDRLVRTSAARYGLAGRRFAADAMAEASAAASSRARVAGDEQPALAPAAATHQTTGAPAEEGGMGSPAVGAPVSTRSQESNWPGSGAQLSLFEGR